MRYDVEGSSLDVWLCTFLFAGTCHDRRLKKKKGQRYRLKKSKLSFGSHLQSLTARRTENGWMR